MGAPEGTALTLGMVQAHPLPAAGALRIPAPAARCAALAVAAIGIEWLRALADRDPSAAVPSLIAGGALLCALAWGVRWDQLGIGRSHLALRILGGLAMAAVLLLPAAVRSGGPVIPAYLSLAAVLVAAGEEIAFRGALYAALERWGGPAFAVVGSTLAFTAAHVLSHPPAFLWAVAAFGLLMGLWRWACRDLVGPIVAHVFADLAL